MPVIRIRDLRFELPDRYSAGHVLTEAEALALNGLRAENIRNNLAGELTRASAAGQSQQELQARVLSYEASYQFGSRGKPAVKASPLELQIERIAQREAFAQLGSGAEPEATRQLVARLRSDPAIQAEAREALEAARKISAKALEDLL